MKKKIFCFDLDNTLCISKNNNYLKSKPKKEAIKTVNHLFHNGHTIKIYTARYMGRCKGNQIKAKKKALPITLKQLKVWGVKYHKIYFGKPSFDIFIDDKALFFKKNWSEVLLKKLSL